MYRDRRPILLSRNTCQVDYSPRRLARDGARCIPLLARAGAHARPGFPFVRPRLAQVWFARWRLSCVLADLESCNLPAQAAQAMVKKESFKRAEKELDGVRKIANCRLLNWTEPEYPQTLLQIYDPPVLLYVRGDVQVLNLPSLSIVGTRRPTLYGTQMAQRLGRELAARGLVIVSGLARGIDAIGHQRGFGCERARHRSSRHGHRCLLPEGKQETV